MMPERKKSLRDLIFLPNANIVDGRDLVKMRECQHRRIKRNFTHGRNSAPKRFCKDCGKPLLKKDFMKKKKKSQPIIKDKYPNISSLI